jgi:hypothetical protein
VTVGKSGRASTCGEMGSRLSYPLSSTTANQVRGMLIDMARVTPRPGLKGDLLSIHSEQHESQHMESGPTPVMSIVFS